MGTKKLIRQREVDGALRKRMTKVIEQRDIDRALRVVGRESYEIGDLKETGLSLRVRQGSAVWTLRGRLGPKRRVPCTGGAALGQEGTPGDAPQVARRITRRIGDAAKMDLKTARDAARAAREDLGRGINPERTLRAWEFRGPVERTFTAEDGWTFEQARKAYLEYVEKERKAATYKDYRIALHSPDVANIFKNRQILLKRLLA